MSWFNIKTGAGVNIVIIFDEDFDWQSRFENKIYTLISPSCRHLLSANLGWQVSIWVVNVDKCQYALIAEHLACIALSTSWLPPDIDISLEFPVPNQDDELRIHYLLSSLKQGMWYLKMAKDTASWLLLWIKTRVYQVLQNFLQLRW